MSHDLIYDWNQRPPGEPQPLPLLNDETLRDGLQSPSVRHPTLDEKIEILHLMEALGIDAVDIGLPGIGPRAHADIEVLAREIATNRMKIKPNVACRTHLDDLSPVANIGQRAGIAIEVGMFVGVSPIRRFVEDWDVASLVTRIDEMVKFAVSEGLPVMLVTEDTTRCDPQTLITLYGTAIRAGATSICLCDTVGHVTPHGSHMLVRFAIEKIIAPTGLDIRIDWHGHNDRGLALAASMSALRAGAHRIHAAANSLGERCGNTSMELMLVNLRLLGLVDRPMQRLKEYSDAVARATGVAVAPNTPIVGSDAFRTTTGVHAAAIRKAYLKGNNELANIVYSGVPSHHFGVEQRIDVGPMSGRSNIMMWLERKGLAVTDEILAAISATARASDHTLTDEEIYAIVGATPT